MLGAKVAGTTAVRPLGPAGSPAARLSLLAGAFGVAGGALGLGFGGPVGEDAFWGALVFCLVVFVTMVYGPIAAWLVELCPARIRYTSMSLPYHIGNGWFGGFLPVTSFAIVAATGNIYNGLWYPVIVAALTVVLGFTPDRIGAIVTKIVFRSATAWELAAIPMFVWMGEMMFRTDISERLFRGLAPLVDGFERLPEPELPEDLAATLRPSGMR